MSTRDAFFNEDGFIGFVTISICLQVQHPKIFRHVFLDFGRVRHKLNRDVEVVGSEFIPVRAAHQVNKVV